MTRSEPPRRPALPLAIAALIGVIVGPTLGGLAAALPVLALCAPVAIALAVSRSRRRATPRWHGPAGRIPIALLIVGLIGLAGTWASRARAGRDALDPAAANGLPRGPLIVRGVLERGPWPAAPGRVELVLASGEARLLVDAPAYALHRGGPLPGSRLRLVARATPLAPATGSRDAAEALRRRGLAARLEAASVVVEAPGRGATAIVGAAARDAGSRIDAAVARARAPLFRALLLGERAALDPALTAAFRATGTVHILSISGLHVTLLALLAGSAVRILGLGRLERVVAVALAIAGYVALAGATVPTLRAAAAGLVAHALLGRGDAWNRLSVAALAVLAWDPLAPRDVGALLSFGTVAAILALEVPARWLCADPRATPERLFGGPRSAVATTLARWGRRALAGALAGFLASAPLVGLVLGDLPLSGLVVNPPVIALCTAALGLAAAGLVVGALLPPLGHGLLALADIPAAAMVRMVEVGASVPGTRWLIPVPPPAAAVLAVGLLALALARASARGAHDRAARGLGVVGAGLLLGLLVPRPPASGGAAAPVPPLRIISPSRGALVVESGGRVVGLGRRPPGGRDRRLEAALGQVPSWEATPWASAPPGLRIDALADGALVRVGSSRGGPSALVLLRDPRALGERLRSIPDADLEADALVILVRARAGSVRELAARSRPTVVIADSPPRGAEALAPGGCLPLTALDHRLVDSPQATAPRSERP